MIAYNISEHSIVFFAKGRPWEVASDNPNFDTIADGLVDGVDIDTLCALADTRVQLAAKGLEFAGDAVVYNGDELHGVWVDKIMLFHDQSANFDPIFKALDNLLTNPTKAAIERLPGFVEESKLGFYPDGRIACFKYVRDDFMDAHSGTVNWAPGQTVTIDRDACEADPNVTCAAGLHVGALSYIKRYGFSGNKRIVLCAVWPSDFVAVPHDYQNGKARVCRAEVIEELDKKFVDDFLKQNQGPVVDNRPAYQRAVVGDWVQVGAGSEAYTPGVYQVVEIADKYETIRLRLQHPNGHIAGVFNKAVLAIVGAPPKLPRYLTACVGDEVGYNGFELDNPRVTVTHIDPDPNSETRLKCEDDYGSRCWVDNEDITD